METPAIHRVVQNLTNPAPLVRRPRDNSHLGQIRKSLCGSSGTGTEGVDTTGYGLDDNNVIRYADEKFRKTNPCLPKYSLGAHFAQASRSRSYFGLDTPSFSLVFVYPPHATIRVIVRGPEAQETESICCPDAR